MSIKCYLAAPWVYRNQAVVAQDAFEAAGLEVTSRWIKGHEDSDSEAELERQAVIDLEDICDADAFVIMNLDKSEGKATELGFAYAMGLPIILVGEKSHNIFYHLPGIAQTETIEQAIEKVKDLYDDK